MHYADWLLLFAIFAIIAATVASISMWAALGCGSWALICLAKATIQRNRIYRDR